MVIIGGFFKTLWVRDAVTLADSNKKISAQFGFKRFDIIDEQQLDYRCRRAIMAFSQNLNCLLNLIPTEFVRFVEQVNRNDCCARKPICVYTNGNESSNNCDGRNASCVPYGGFRGGYAAVSRYHPYDSSQYAMNNGGTHGHGIGKSSLIGQGRSPLLPALPIEGLISKQNQQLQMHKEEPLAIENAKLKEQNFQNQVKLQVAKEKEECFMVEMKNLVSVLKEKTENDSNKCGGININSSSQINIIQAGGNVSNANLSITVVHKTSFEVELPKYMETIKKNKAFFFDFLKKLAINQLAENTNDKPSIQKTDDELMAETVNQEVNKQTNAMDVDCDSELSIFTKDFIADVVWMQRNQKNFTLADCKNIKNKMGSPFIDFYQDVEDIHRVERLAVVRIKSKLQKQIDGVQYIDISSCGVFFNYAFGLKLRIQRGVTICMIVLVQNAFSIMLGEDMAQTINDAMFAQLTKSVLLDFPGKGVNAYFFANLRFGDFYINVINIKFKNKKKYSQKRRFGSSNVLDVTKNVIYKLCQRERSKNNGEMYEKSAFIICYKEGKFRHCVFAIPREGISKGILSRELKNEEVLMGNFDIGASAKQAHVFSKQLFVFNCSIDDIDNPCKHTWTGDYEKKLNRFDKLCGNGEVTGIYKLLLEKDALISEKGGLVSYSASEKMRELDVTNFYPIMQNEKMDLKCPYNIGDKVYWMWSDSASKAAPELWIGLITDIKKLAKAVNGEEYMINVQSADLNGVSKSEYSWIFPSVIVRDVEKQLKQLMKTKPFVIGNYDNNEIKEYSEAGTDSEWSDTE